MIIPLVPDQCPRRNRRLELKGIVQFLTDLVFRGSTYEPSIHPNAIDNIIDKIMEEESLQLNYPRFHAIDAIRSNSEEF